MKKKSERIETIRNISVKAEEKAAIVLSQCNAKLLALENQLQKLYQYRDEYNRKFTEAGNQQLNTNKLKDYILFINSISHNIDKILNSIEVQKNACKKAQQAWFEKHQRVNIYNKVKSNYLEQEIKEENKKEQKLNDESSNAFYFRNIPRQQ